MYKKLIAGLLAFVFVISSFSGMARAAPGVDIENSKWMVVTKLKSFNQTLNNTYRGEYGLMYNLYYLTLSTRWVDLMTSVQQLNFDDQEKSIYRKELLRNYKKFNEKFSKKVEEEDSDFYYKNFTIRIDSNKFKNNIKYFVEKDVPLYVQGRLDNVLKKLSEVETEEDKNKILESNKEVLRYSYRILEALVNEHLEMKALVNEPTTSSIPHPLDVLTRSDLAAEILANEKYADLINQGRSLAEEESTEFDNVGYENADTYIEELAYAKKNENAQRNDFGSDVWSPLEGDTFKLRDTYVAMIASTAIYRPFDSYVGDKEYLDALKYLSSDDKATDIEKLFNEIKDYRKPLWTIEDAGWWNNAFRGATTEEASFPTYAGTGKRLTIADFLNRIENEDVSGFVTVKGNFKKVGSDGDSWGFFQENPLMLDDVITESTVPTPNDSTEGTEEETAEEPESPPKTGSNSKNSVIVMAEDKINTTKWTSSLFEFGYQDGYPITGLALMKNYIKDSARLISKIENPKSRYLFINAIGDIVTDDNLVIIPAAANPMLYDQTVGYNPYTVAFMNGYPDIYVSGKDKLNMSNPDDKGKFMLLSEAEEIDAKKVFIKIQGEKNLAVTHAKQPINFFRQFIDVGQGTEPIFGRTNAKIPGWWESRQGMLVFGTEDMRAHNVVVSSVNSVPIFEYSSELDKDGTIAKLIVRNMYWSYKNSNGQASENFNGRLREDFIFKNILVEGLGGNIYSTAYTKNSVENYENMANDGFGRMKRTVVDWARDTLGSLGKVDGVLGIKNRYQDPILGKFLTVVNDYFWFIVLILLFAFLVMFLKQRITLLPAASMLLVSFVIIFAFIRIIPVYFPLGYNLFVNNLGKNLSYQILSTKIEKYRDTYGNNGQFTEDGKYTMSTTSVNLYKLDDRGLAEIEARYNVNPREIMSGKPYILDSQNGVYVEGDTLKVNVDMLVSANPIVGSYSETEGKALYQYEAKKMNSSSIDYYMPYHMIVDGFTDSLNKLLQAYKIPRHASTYAKGFEKDSFIVYSYLNSIPFLTPDNFEQQTDEVRPEEVEKLKKLFPEPHDFLGLHSMLKNPTPEMKESLWYRTMEQNGYFENTEASQQKYSDLILSVNNLTKKFLIDMKPKVGMISDENLIKMTALHATTILNQKASEPANWLYPISLNYQEYSYEDVLLAAFTDDYSSFIAEDMDVASYVGTQTDAMTVLIFLIDVVLGFIINVSIQALVPVLYILVGILMVFRFIAGEKLAPAVKGYLKMSALLFGCLTVFVLALSVVNNINITAAIYGLLIVYLFIMFILYMVVSSVLVNITEMGNSSINAKFEKMFEKLPDFKTLNDLKVLTTNLFKGDQTSIAVDRTGPVEYKHDHDIDELSDDPTVVRRALKRKRQARASESYIRQEDAEVRRSVNGDESYSSGKLDYLDDYRN